MFYILLTECDRCAENTTCVNEFGFCVAFGQLTDYGSQLPNSFMMDCAAGRSYPNTYTNERKMSNFSRLNCENPVEKVTRELKEPNMFPITMYLSFN